MDENPSPSAELKAKLKKCDPEVQDFIAALRSKISQCANQSAHLEAENIALHVRIESLREELEGKAKTETEAEEQSDNLRRLFRQGIENSGKNKRTS